jgi:hypothetical protein
MHRGFSSQSWQLSQLKCQGGVCGEHCPLTHLGGGEQGLQGKGVGNKGGKGKVVQPCMHPTG